MIKRISLIAFLMLSAISFSLQAQDAKQILDRTSDTFRKAGGVEAEFTLRMEQVGQPSGLLTGTIRLKGEKFVLQATDAITWFDGTTQWSYLVDSDEVNVSNPTEEELQGINPYSLLTLYEKGYSYELGKKTSYQGKAVYEVILTSKVKGSDISTLKLYIAKQAYYPIAIIAELNNNSINEISIVKYKQGVNFADDLFVFNRKDYPQAEIIDLR